jgi:uncharacterized membrane protein HdeD (DUF308 family)
MTSASTFDNANELVTEPVRQKRGWFILLGIVLVLCGIFAIMTPLASTLAASLVVGIALAVAGLMQIIHAFQAKAWSGFFWHLLVGVIQFAGGVFIWLNPFAGAVAITIMMAWVFFLQGAAEIALAFKVRPNDGWGWLLFSGALAVIAGLWLMMRFPVAGLFAPGLIVGFALVGEGIAFIAIGMTARRAAPA